jgi:hypothetical protein
VTTREELDALSARQLHDMAIHRAEKHADVKFLWDVLRALPAAEAYEGHEGHAEMDITSVSGLLSDALTSGKTDVSDALRPMYTDYLLKHS